MQSIYNSTISMCCTPSFCGHFKTVEREILYSIYHANTQAARRSMKIKIYLAQKCAHLKKCLLFLSLLFLDIYETRHIFVWLQQNKSLVGLNRFLQTYIWVAYLKVWLGSLQKMGYYYMYEVCRIGVCVWNPLIFSFPHSSADNANAVWDYK